MNKFHQIPTDTFAPVSHDSSYLFTHYERVANFLAFNLQKNYKNILAKPVQNNYVIDWFSVYDNLVNINEKSKEDSQSELDKYWQFIDVINATITRLSSSNDENDKNWASLLTKVFNHSDNFIFSNGGDICIVWGWKFYNNEFHKPNLGESKILLTNVGETSIPSPTIEITEKTPTHEPQIIEKPKPENPVSITDVDVIEEVSDEDLEGHIRKDSYFKNFLKWFASKFWWFLLILLLFIIASLLFNSCNNREVNRKLDVLEGKANQCCN